MLHRAEFWLKKTLAFRRLLSQLMFPYKCPAGICSNEIRRWKVPIKVSTLLSLNFSTSRSRNSLAISSCTASSWIMRRTSTGRSPVIMLRRNLKRTFFQTFKRNAFKFKCHWHNVFGLRFDRLIRERLPLKSLSSKSAVWFCFNRDFTDRRKCFVAWMVSPLASKPTR